MVADNGNLVRHGAQLMIIVEDHRGLGPTLAALGALDVSELPRMLSKWMRRGSSVAVARKSREPNMIRLLGAKVSPPADEGDWAIGVESVAWHANGPLLGAPTVVVLETEDNKICVWQGR